MKNKIILNRNEEELFSKLKTLRESMKDYEQMEEILPEEERLNWKHVTRDALCVMRNLHDTLNINYLNNNDYWKGKIHHINDELLSDYMSFNFKTHIKTIDEFAKFIELDTLRVEPISLNLDVCFDHHLYSPYFGEKKRVQIRKTENGWAVKYMTDSVEDDKRCTHFQKLLEDHSIAYPNVIGDAVEHLWEKASTKLEPKEVDKEVNDLFEWISMTTSTKPTSVTLTPEWQKVGVFPEI